MTHEATTRKQLSAPLDEYVRQFEDLARDAHDLTASLSAEQFNWSPEAGRWSIAQCLDHLNAVAKPYAEALTRGIAEAKSRGQAAGPGVSYSWLERWMIRSLEPPPGRRLPAPKMFAPAASADHYQVDGVVSEFTTIRAGLIELLELANAVDVGRAKITSPVTRFLRLRIGAAFAFLAAHDRRHIWQARQVRKSSGFPES